MLPSHGHFTRRGLPGAYQELIPTPRPAPTLSWHLRRLQSPQTPTRRPIRLASHRGCVAPPRILSHPSRPVPPSFAFPPPHPPHHPRRAGPACVLEKKNCLKKGRGVHTTDFHPPTGDEVWSVAGPPAIPRAIHEFHRGGHKFVGAPRTHGDGRSRRARPCHPLACHPAWLVPLLNRPRCGTATVDPHPLAGHRVASVALSASPCATAVPPVPPSVPLAAPPHSAASIRDKAEGNLAVTPGFAACLPHSTPYSALNAPSAFSTPAFSNCCLS